MTNPILSICIPTYNRVANLEETINSIVNQRRFQETNDIEIVILDNGSTDNTNKVIIDFEKKHKEKIRWYRNEKNDMYLDLEKLFSSGKGVFLKFNNDTLKHNEGSLDKMIQTICDCQNDATTPFFSTGVLKIEKNILCSTVDSFVEVVSYWSGWMAGFGIWKDDFLNFKEFDRYSHLQLPQVDIIFRLINSQKSFLVNNENLFISIPPLKKGGYDLITVFLDNYIFLLTEQLNNGALTEKTYLVEKRKLLLQFIRPWLVLLRIYPEKYYFTANNYFHRIVHYYKKDKVVLAQFIIYYNLALCYNFFKKSIKSCFNWSSTLVNNFKKSQH